MTGSGGQRRVPTNFVSSLRLRLPPLTEQRRIAAILDAAAAVSLRRRTSRQRLIELSNAEFVAEMRTFAAAPTVPVGELVDDALGGIRTGPFGSQLLHSEFVDEGVAVLGIDNAVANEFQPGAKRFITQEKYAQLQRYTVRAGDVLITIMGTCGRAAVVPDDIGPAINTKHLCCISLDRSRCLPEFLHAYFLRHPEARQYLTARAKGAIMSGLNMGIIKELPVRLPPINVQEALVRRLGRVQALRRTAVEHESALDRLFASLQRHAFAGDM